MPDTKVSGLDAFPAGGCWATAIVQTSRSVISNLRFMQKPPDVPSDEGTPPKIGHKISPKAFGFATGGKLLNVAAKIIRGENAAPTLVALSMTEGVEARLVT
jgi:hypothetical protein